MSIKFGIWMFTNGIVIQDVRKLVSLEEMLQLWLFILPLTYSNSYALLLMENNDHVVIKEMKWEWHKRAGKITQKGIILTNETILVITLLAMKMFYLKRI